MKILWQDDAIIAVEKPAGMLVHPTDLTGRETTCVDVVSEIAGCRVMPIHRLDRKVAGVLLFAKSSAVARVLGSQFQNREVEKHYVALVRGWTEESFEVDHEVPSIRGHCKRQATTVFKQLAKTEIAASISKYDTARFSLVSAQPLTGRYHQIRRHLKHVHHPIIGDTVYGRGEYNQFFRRHFDYEGMFLVAVGLKFCHPLSAERVHITCELNADLSQLIHRLGFPD
jgi:tRNA pseudouridine65 synthase